MKTPKYVLIIGLLLCFVCCLTGCGAEYDQNDIAAINQLIDEHGWDVPKDDVKAWDFVTSWSKDNPRRVESIAHYYGEQPVAGTLDVSALTGLTFLNVHSNHIETLVLPESIVYLTCPYNNLKELDLSNAKNLEDLSCAGNEELTKISYDYLPALKGLHCSGGQLAELDLEGLPNIQSIDVSFNRLTELDISSAPNLVSVDCSNNQITELQIDNTPNLRHLSVYDDAFMNCYSNKLKFVSLDYATRQIVLQQPDVEEISRDEWEGIPENVVIEGNLLKFIIEVPNGATGINIENVAEKKLVDFLTV